MSDSGEPKASEQEETQPTGQESQPQQGMYAFFSLSYGKAVLPD